MDLKKMSRKQLEKARADIDKALGRLEKSEMKAARDAAEKAARSHGFSLSEITSGEKASKIAKPKSAKAAPKFANPADASQTWSGKGRKPDWFKSAVAAGTDPADMTISN